MKETIPWKAKKIKVSSEVKSAYAGKLGQPLALEKGYVQIVFSFGHMSGVGLWFHLSDLEV